MPQAIDSTFEKVVVYICEHSEQGAVGLIVNRPTDYTLQFIFDQLNIETLAEEVNAAPVLLGGPVQQDRGFVIHKPLPGFKPSINVSKDVCVSTSQDILRRIARGEGPEEMLFVLGYAGWAGLQLDEEIKQNIWLTCEATNEILYNLPFEKRWQKAIDHIGIGDLTKLTLGSGCA